MEEGLQIAITSNVEQLNSYLRKHGGVFLRAGLEGTLYTLAVRPLSRPALLLGKFAGQAAMLMIYAALFFLALAGLVYWQLGVVPGLGMALALFILEPLVLLAVTVLGTVWLPTLGNGILVFALYVVSMVGGMIEQIGSCWKVPLPSIYIGVISSLLLPADVVYRRLVHTLVGRMAPADMSMGITNLQDFLGPCGSLSTPSNWMLLYILVYIAGLLAAAVYLFYI